MVYTGWLKSKYPSSKFAISIGNRSEYYSYFTLALLAIHVLCASFEMSRSVIFRSRIFKSCIFQSGYVVRHFQVLHFQALRFSWSVIFRSCILQQILSVIFRSCIFRPCYMARHFPGLAFSGLVIFVVRHFQVLHFQRPRTDMHDAAITEKNLKSTINRKYSLSDKLSAAVHR